MKDNKKVDVKNIYYVTLKNLETNKKEYAIVEFKNGNFIDLKTDEQYNDKSNNNIKIYGITPYRSINHDTFGKISIKEILERDSFISKKYNEEYGEYIFNNTQEIQETFAIIKADSKNDIIKSIEMIYNSGLKIEKYEVRFLDEELSNKLYEDFKKNNLDYETHNFRLPKQVVIMVLKGVNAVDKFKNLIGSNDGNAEKDTIRGVLGVDTLYNAIYGSDTKFKAEIEIKQFFKEKQKRI